MAVLVVSAGQVWVSELMVPAVGTAAAPVVVLVVLAEQVAELVRLGRPVVRAVGLVVVLVVVLVVFAEQVAELVRLGRPVVRAVGLVVVLVVVLVVFAEQVAELVRLGRPVVRAVGLVVVLVVVLVVLAEQVAELVRLGRPVVRAVGPVVVPVLAASVEWAPVRERVIPAVEPVLVRAAGFAGSAEGSAPAWSWGFAAGRAQVQGSTVLELPASMVSGWTVVSERAGGLVVPVSTAQWCRVASGRGWTESGWLAADPVAAVGVRSIPV
ncbi:hypothetical protein [Nocardia sp. NBC_00403]|uniref:hypothetical protein n=1 Tax=Nocardia sp. NBC_00403 TaxID=2975990 RepID=UPI002E201FF6